MDFTPVTPLVVDGKLLLLLAAILVLDDNWFMLFAGVMLIALGFVTIGV